MPMLSIKFRKGLLAARRWGQQGFTLLELLVAILIGGIITSGLLFLVVELMAVNNREESLTQTQQDMRRAIDYITRDLSEAVFVYGDLTDILPELDDIASGDLNGATPVLGFWRLDPLTDDEVKAVDTYCAAQTDGTPEKSECETLLVRQSYYTLVVYLQKTNDDPSDIWDGPSRILRYELSKYQKISSSTLDERSGYADPTLPLSDGSFNTFETWKAASAATDGNADVLTDFVDQIDTNQVTACPTSDYVRIPDKSDSFYVCVATPSSDNNDQSVNKSVIVYLQGNASKNDPNRLIGLTEASSLPKLESEVLIRGVIQDDPTDGD